RKGRTEGRTVLQTDGPSFASSSEQFSSLSSFLYPISWNHETQHNKAYARLLWLFITKILRKFGFNEAIIDVVYRIQILRKFGFNEAIIDMEIIDEKETLRAISLKFDGRSYENTNITSPCNSCVTPCDAKSGARTCILPLTGHGKGGAKNLDGKNKTCHTLVT
ncbi:hypothetical protein HAX54_038884, partial [Datura stramonium]|nr:hypothetical protein [Datura stramonium]